VYWAQVSLVPRTVWVTLPEEVLKAVSVLVEVGVVVPLEVPPEVTSVSLLQEEKETISRIKTSSLDMGGISTKV
jgi:hypothetical protein